MGVVGIVAKGRSSPTRAKGASRRRPSERNEGTGRADSRPGHQGLLAAQELGIDLGELLQLLLKLAIVVHPRFGLLLLRLALEEELIDFAHGQTLSEIEERAVFIPSVMTVAIGFAALGKALNKGGPEEVGMNLEVFEEKFLALAQSQSGFAFKVEYPSHIQG